MIKEEDREAVDEMTHYNVGNEEEERQETKDAWALPQMKRWKVAYLSMLMVVGKFRFLLNI